MKKVVLPAEIRKAMKDYQLGLSGLPKSYVEFHKQLAEQKIEELKAKGIIIHNTYMASDGWADGMDVLHVIIEEGGRLDKLKYSDFNQGWMIHHSSGGWSGYPRIEREDLYTQVTNDLGVTFNIRLLRSGDRYGLDRKLINGDRLSVEFYDSRGKGDELGQFVSRYLYSTIVENDKQQRGLALYGDVAEWTLTAQNMRDAISWMKQTIKEHHIIH